MANTIALAEQYLPLLDRIYKKAATSAVLESNGNLIKNSTMNADTVYIPKITLQGLADYARNTGYTSGDVTFEYQSHTFSQERGRKFSVDRFDDIETQNQAFGALAGEFIRTMVVPEVDAYRYATMYEKAGTTEEADLTNSTVDAAIEAGIVVLDEAEVPREDRILFVTPTVKSLIRRSDAYVRNLNAVTGGGINTEFDTYNGMRVVTVPQGRFYTAITQRDGTTGGQEAGGYIKNAGTGKNLNFMIADAKAVMAIVKTARPKIISPEANQDADAYIFGYRLYHDLFVPDNKVDGIYAHNATT